MDRIQWKKRRRVTGGEGGKEGRGHIVQKFMRMFSAFSLFMLFKPNSCFESYLLQEAVSACSDSETLPL